MESPTVFGPLQGGPTSKLFKASTWLNDPAILEKIGPNGASVANISRLQASVLNQLLSTTRMSALAELEVTQPEDAYPLAEFLDDVRAAVWQDLARVSEIGPYRRAPQRAYLERMESLMTEEPPSFPFGPVTQDVSTSDIRSLVREQLRSLRDGVSRRVERGGGDRVTGAHLADIVARIDAILEPGSG